MIEPSDVRIVVRGDVGEKEKQHARRQVAHATHRVRDPMLFARVKLTVSQDPANERPAVARAEVDVNGRVVHAVADAPSVHEAVDHMGERLRRQLEHLVDRRLARRARGAESPGSHEWRHGDRPAARPSFHPRPPEDRQLVRHRTYASTSLTVAEAADQMALLEYDFHLFEDAETGRDAVVERLADGGVRARLVPDGPGPSDTVPPVPTLTIDEAARDLDLAGSRWLFFRDRTTGRGAVVHRRYDGHYGLVTTE